jgi:hypothetical protein
LSVLLSIKYITQMSTTFPTTRPDVGPWDWVRGAVGGFIGSVAFGLMMAFIMPPPLLEVVIPSVADWFDPRTIGGAIVHGIIWGVATTLVFAVIVMPIWLQAVGFPQAPPFPNIGPATLMSTLGHIVYAVPLGLFYAFHRS